MTIYRPDALPDVIRQKHSLGLNFSAICLKLNTDKNELLWAGSRHSLSQQDCCPPVLQLCPDTIVARDYVRLL